MDDRLIEWLGDSKVKNGTPINLTSSSMSEEQKQLASLWQEEGVDLQKFTLEDLDAALKKRSEAITATAPENYIEHSVNRTGLDVSHNLSLKNKTTGRENGNLILSEKPDETLHVFSVTNTSPHSDRVRGVQETMTNGAVDVAHSYGKDGVVSGELLMSPEITTKVYKYFPEKQVINNNGFWQWEDFSKGAFGNPVYNITGHSTRYSTPTKSRVFYPSIVDKGKMKINWLDPNIFKGVAAATILKSASNGKSE